MEKLERYLYRKADGVFGQSEEILNHVAAKMNTNLTRSSFARLLPKGRKNGTNRNKTTDGTDIDPDVFQAGASRWGVRPFFCGENMRVWKDCVI